MIKLDNTSFGKDTRVIAITANEWGILLDALNQAIDWCEDDGYEDWIALLNELSDI